MSYTITFEHPLNETMRICLAIEQLMAQARHETKNISNYWETKNLINTIIKIITVTERPDLKNKLTKALTNKYQALSILENNNNVDQKILAQTLAEIETNIRHIESCNNPIYDLIPNKFYFR